MASLNRLRILAARAIAWLLFQGPAHITLGGRRYIFDPKTGRVLPAIAGADDDPEDPEPDDPKPDPKDDPKPDPKDPEPDDDPDDPEDPPETDWKKMARKHEREAKRAKRDREELAAKLKEREDADRSEQDKAIEQARKEARTEALSEADKERRSDRLEGAVLRLAAKGVKIGTGDDEKTIKFEDPEDAYVFVERRLNRGDLDAEDIFDDAGKVKADVIAETLAEILEDKPRLAASTGESSGKPSGSADAGKGKGASGGEPSVEDIAKKMAIGNK